MKIYIVTFCNTTNVGAALQEYALQEFLKTCGHEVKVVNYVPKIMAEINSVWAAVIRSRTISQFFRGIILLPVCFVRKVKYIQFTKKYITLTAVCKNVADIEKIEQPDVYFVGSDQVWNDEMLNWDLGFFLQFCTTAKKAAYAASAGKDEFSIEFLSKLKKMTKDFSRISVREDVLKNAFERIGVYNVEHVLDPVFLLSKSYYESMIKKPKINNYILLYEAEINDNCILVARQLAKYYKLKIVQINRIHNKYRVDKLSPCTSPTDFLGLVKFADYIITNSFHAVAFSLIFEKQFWTVKLEKRFSRLESLLQLVGLEERILNDGLQKNEKIIDYKKVNIRLQKQKEKSIDFINSVING